MRETYTKDGKTVSYQPPVYDYEFDYTMRIKVNTPWFDDMDFRLNTFSISSEKRGELMEVEQTATSDHCGTDTKCMPEYAWNEHEHRDAAWNGA